MMVLPQTCERALLERFLRAEAMALWAVRAAQTQNLPRHVQTFLQRHETDEQDHLRQFEGMLGTTSQRAPTLPTVPSQWEMLAVLLFGYEALGLEFATLLATVRPDLADILEDEQVHVGFFEKELRIDSGGRGERSSTGAGGGTHLVEEAASHGGPVSR
jgi:demethoxyubiquinone hydroxylase (CLK1/Coq7/Cat5 family)